MMNDENLLKERLVRLDAAIAGGGATADDYYNRGRLYWKLGDKGRAISDYNSAVALDADSPAAEALKLASSVMDFYHTDLYNP